MRVNSALSLLNNRLVMWCCLAIALGTLFLMASSFTKRTDRDLQAKQTNIIIRDIGHRLLLQAGDRTSRVLPVTEIKEGTFQLTFENRLVFNHDSLMALTQRLLPKAKFPSGYTVTVQDCNNTEIVYGFQINNNTPDILACNGRSQPAGCYVIEFTFPDFYGTTLNYPLMGLVGSGVLMVSAVALLIGRFGKRATPVPVPVLNPDHTTLKQPVSELTVLGSFLFDARNQRLLLNNEVINLTDKECKVLELLHAHFGELTPRDTLMQVWINEGVITGRSLDMFVSKLRKKLSADPQLSITNVHGKGYKLEAKSSA